MVIWLVTDGAAPECADRAGLDARTAGSVVVAGLAVAIGRGIGAEMIADIFGPHPTRVGGELAGDRARGGRQQRIVIPAVGEAVAEETVWSKADSAMAGAAAIAMAMAIRERIGRSVEAIGMPA
ncbi:hypothetical protein [Xanthomonas citri]|uniref:hypothetical protein n=1 Tax=Xanthomonas citri TaxID=346 RepID=UPI001E40C1D3|nr:hypothetical protein [Xanthomonas citri]